MNEDNFTKGEWSVQFEDMIFASCGVNNEQVAVVCNEENKDKNLIAAAPEMYVMLKKVAQAQEDSGNEIEHSDLLYSLYDDIELLLAKARGES